MSKIPKLALAEELSFRASRSGGAGGQHVNKVSTRVEAMFDVQASAILSENQKERIFEKLGNRINKEGVLSISVDDERSQKRNKDIAITRLHELIEEALRVPKKRKPTKATRASRERRLKAKKNRSDLKSSRRKPEL